MNHTPSFSSAPLRAHPQRQRSRVAALGLAVALLASGGCSLVLSWESDEQLCLNGRCSPLFSCLVATCVPDQSVEEGATCNLDVQCADGRICAPEVFTCRLQCSTYFASERECGPGQFCAPLRADDLWVGACLPDSGCATNTPACLGVQTCVQTSADASDCMVPCEVKFDPTTGGYSDDCAPTSSAPVYCQPVGFRGKEQLVCLEAGERNEGNQCNAFSSACRNGFACHAGTCRKYCSLGGTGCDNGQICCDVIRVDKVGLCLPAGCG